MRCVIVFFTCLTVQLALVGCASIEGKVSSEIFEVRTGPGHGLPSESTVLVSVDAWARSNGFVRAQPGPREPKGIVEYKLPALVSSKEHVGIAALYLPGKVKLVLISLTGGRYLDAEQKEIDGLVEDFRRRTAFRLETLDGKPFHTVIQ